LTKMIESFRQGAELVVGSRIGRGSKIERCLQREVLSRGYNFFIKMIMGSRFSDAQCGFKGISIKAARHLLPLTENTEWFFDTELLLLAEYLDYRIEEIPVTWIEDRDSRVNIPKTVMEDIKGLYRMKKTFLFDKTFRERCMPIGDSV